MRLGSTRAVIYHFSPYEDHFASNVVPLGHSLPADHLVAVVLLCQYPHARLDHAPPQPEDQVEGGLWRGENRKHANVPKIHDYGDEMAIGTAGSRLGLGLHPITPNSPRLELGLGLG